MSSSRMSSGATSPRVPWGPAGRAWGALLVLDRVADDLLGDGQRRRDADRDLEADRELVRAAVQRAHRRSARRRLIVRRS